MRRLMFRGFRSKDVLSKWEIGFCALEYVYWRLLRGTELAMESGYGSGLLVCVKSRCTYEDTTGG